MNLYTPEIGAKLILSEDWSMILYDEYRNDALFKAFNLQRGKTHNNKKNQLIVIPKDTILTVRRVYIRQGLSAYSSITFSIAKKESPNKDLWGVRFWSSLNDVNQIKFELKECNEDVLKTVEECLILIKDKAPYPNMYREIESALLEGKTINTFRPIEEGFIFFRKAVERLKELSNDYNSDDDPIIYSDALKIVNTTFRKYKIAKMLIDETEVEESEII